MKCPFELPVRSIAMQTVMSIKDCLGHTVAYCHCKGFGNRWPSEAEDNAKYITDAINSHDKLLEMLAELVAVARIANDPDAILGMDAEGVVIGYLNGPSWDAARALMAELEQPNV